MSNHIWMFKDGECIFERELSASELAFQVGNDLWKMQINVLNPTPDFVQLHIEDWVEFLKAMEEYYG